MMLETPVRAHKMRGCQINVFLCRAPSEVFCQRTGVPPRGRGVGCRLHIVKLVRSERNKINSHSEVDYTLHSSQLKRNHAWPCPQ